jgi:hypothetical protein
MHRDWLRDAPAQIRPKAGGRIGSVMQLDKAQIQIASRRSRVGACETTAGGTDRGRRQRESNVESPADGRSAKQRDLHGVGVWSRVSRSRGNPAKHWYL